MSRYGPICTLKYPPTDGAFVLDPRTDVIDSLRRLNLDRFVGQKREREFDEKTHQTRRVEDKLVSRSIAITNNRVQS